MNKGKERISFRVIFVRKSKEKQLKTRTTYKINRNDYWKWKNDKTKSEKKSWETKENIKISPKEFVYQKCNQRIRRKIC